MRRRKRTARPEPALRPALAVTHRRGQPFTVFGRVYQDLSDLTHTRTGPVTSFAGFPVPAAEYRDVHGFPVIEAYRRFPCFDEFDAMYENRYHCWCLISDGKRLAEIRWDTDSSAFTVAEGLLEPGWELSDLLAGAQYRTILKMDPL